MTPSLQQRLDQYTRSSHGQPGRSTAEIAGYAAAMGAGLAGGGDGGSGGIASAPSHSALNRSINHHQRGKPCSTNSI